MLVVLFHIPKYRFLRIIIFILKIKVFKKLQKRFYLDDPMSWYRANGDGWGDMDVVTQTKFGANGYVHVFDRFFSPTDVEDFILSQMQEISAKWLDEAIAHLRKATHRDTVIFLMNKSKPTDILTSYHLAMLNMARDILFGYSTTEWIWGTTLFTDTKAIMKEDMSSSAHYKQGGDILYILVYIYAECKYLHQRMREP